MLEEQLYGCALTSLKAHGTELLGCGDGILHGRLGSECVHARHCSGPRWEPGKADKMVTYIKLWKKEFHWPALWWTFHQQIAELQSLCWTGTTNWQLQLNEHSLPGIPGGRSTGRRRWAACCQTQPHTQLGLEQGPGHGAGKALRCQQGAAAGTQKLFPDPPVAASLWTHTRKSSETWAQHNIWGLFHKTQSSVKLSESFKPVLIFWGTCGSNFIFSTSTEFMGTHGSYPLLSLGIKKKIITWSLNM